MCPPKAMNYYFIERAFTKPHVKRFYNKMKHKAKKDGGEDFSCCMKFKILNSLQKRYLLMQKAILTSL